MNQNTKIILGIVLLGGAYYLYTRKKPEAVVNKRIGEIDRGYSVKTVDNSKLPKWRLKRDISSGRIPDNELIFKKGDFISGAITKQSIGSKNGQGVVAYKEWSVIRAFPTVKTAKFNIEFPINLDDLEEVR